MHRDHYPSGLSFSPAAIAGTDQTDRLLEIEPAILSSQAWAWPGQPELLHAMSGHSGMHQPDLRDRFRWEASNQCNCMPRLYLPTCLDMTVPSPCLWGHRAPLALTRVFLLLAADWPRPRTRMVPAGWVMRSLSKLTVSCRFPRCENERTSGVDLVIQPRGHRLNWRRPE